MPVPVACQGCGVVVLVSPAVAKYKRFCSRRCCDAAKCFEYLAARNPNFRGASIRTCEQCGREYQSYEKDRRFCSRACVTKSPGWQLAQRTKKPSRPKSFHSAVCGICGTSFTSPGPRTGIKARRYCSSACGREANARATRGERSARWNGGKRRYQCIRCGAEMWSYRKRVHCSHACHAKTKREEFMVRLRPRLRRDANHSEIVAAFQKFGWYVVDLSSVGGGVPDIVIGDSTNGLFFVEIKSPTTAYGKSGLSKSQKRFEAEWQGTVHIVRTLDDVIALTKQLTGKAIADGRRPKTVKLSSVADAEAFDRGDLRAD